MLTTDLADEDFCYLSTIGRVTGRVHTIEIWFASLGPELYLLAGGGASSDWVRNLEVDPIVRVRIRSQEWVGWARVMADDADRDAAAALVVSKYQPRYEGDLTGWRDKALPVAILLAEGLEPRPEQ